MERKEELIGVYQQRDFEHIRENRRLSKEVERLTDENIALRKLLAMYLGNHNGRVQRLEDVERFAPVSIYLEENIGNEIIVKVVKE